MIEVYNSNIYHKKHYRLGLVIAYNSVIREDIGKENNRSIRSCLNVLFICGFIANIVGDWHENFSKCENDKHGGNKNKAIGHAPAGEYVARN